MLPLRAAAGKTRWRYGADVLVGKGFRCKNTTGVGGSPWGGSDTEMNALGREAEVSLRGARAQKASSGAHGNIGVHRAAARGESNRLLTWNIKSYSRNWPGWRDWKPCYGGEGKKPQFSQAYLMQK